MAARARGAEELAHDFGRLTREADLKPLTIGVW